MKKLAIGLLVILLCGCQTQSPDIISQTPSRAPVVYDKWMVVQAGEQLDCQKYVADLLVVAVLGLVPIFEPIELEPGNMYLMWPAENEWYGNHSVKYLHTPGSVYCRQ